ncbi:MAG: hypothetical protein JST00_20300 [Deltaproteobacteria bacterium]|nr:hypothetical protein [Deltaproteobacteria bacterium]
MKRVLFAIAAGSAVALVVACSSSTVAVQPTPSTPDAGEADAQPAVDGTAPTDASPTEAGSSCEGSCKVTSLLATFGGKTRTLVRSQHGTQPGDGGTELHAEAHLGGAPECPTETSPQTDYTFVLTAVPRGRTGKLTEADGPKAAFFDFKGDLGLPPIAKATKIEVTVSAIDGASPPAWVAMDVSATFPEGTVSGHLYAAHCTSLDQ